MADPATYEVVPEEQFRRVSAHRRSIDARSRYCARSPHGASGEAQERDLPRRWLVSDESILELARRAPRDRAALSEVRGLNEQSRSTDGEAVLDAVKRGLEVLRTSFQDSQAQARARGCGRAC